MNKVALVNGGTHGFGLEMVDKLLRAGYDVYAISSDRKRIKKYNDIWTDAVWSHVNTKELIYVNKYIEVLFNYVDHIDVLINNAEIDCVGNTERVSISDWDKAFCTNVTGLINLTRAVLPLLKNSNNPCIINAPTVPLESELDYIGFASCDAVYAAITKSMAIDFAKYGIRVNSVSRSVLKSHYVSVLSCNRFELYRVDADGNQHILANFGDPAFRGLCALTMFLISDKAGMITGDNYCVQSYEPTGY